MVSVAPPPPPPLTERRRLGTAARLVALVANPAVATTFLGRAATTPRRATNVAAAVGTTVAARALTALALPFRRVPASRLRRPARCGSLRLPGWAVPSSG